MSIILAIFPYNVQTIRPNKGVYVITELWHNPSNYDVRRDPLYPFDYSQIVDIWVGTYPCEWGQSVWVCYQEFDSTGNLIPDATSQAINPDNPPNPMHYVQCNWRYNNSDDNSYWCGKLGPFSPQTSRVLYTIFARQGRKIITISSPDFFDFQLSQLIRSVATGGPGRGDSWASGAKEGVCTAYSDQSHVWFSHSKGTINEIYYPQLDNPCIRDFQFLVLDNEGKFIDPKKADSKAEFLDTLVANSGDAIPRSLAYRITNMDSGSGGSSSKRYELTMDAITDPVENTVLIGMRYTPLVASAAKYRVFALLNPSISNSGANDTCKFLMYQNVLMFLTWENGYYCALAINRPVSKYECGFCGVNDGWTDLVANKDLTYGFTEANNGDVVGIMEIQLPSASPTATVSISFGRSEEEALARAYRTVSKDIGFVSSLFIDQWKGYINNLEVNGYLTSITANQSLLNRKLAYVSTMCVKAMEDKVNKGAIIASMSIPWGECKDGVYGGYHAKDAGGYHLVWGRDLYNMATAALAIGDYATALNILYYFDRVLQENNGSMPQNTWIDGTPYWTGEQIDETGYPLILAWRLKTLGKLDRQEVGSLYKSLIVPAAEYLANYEHTWTQDRWEEVWGRSPFAVAVVVAGLIVSAQWADERNDSVRGNRWRENAKHFAINDLRDCYVSQGGKEYFARIYNPGNSDYSKFIIDIDAGFLELVRLGVKSPTGAQIRSSVAVVDDCIRKVINGHVYFLRYGRIDKRDAECKDTYGEADNGKCWNGDASGRGRLWPLLSGERGHYELINSGVSEAQKYLDAIASTANSGFMLAEQIWDGVPIPRDEHGNPLAVGKGTKSATPLGWTHGEYLKLMRSVHDNALFDQLPEVVDFCKKNGIY
jgi:glucoamylase